MHEPYGLLVFDQEDLLFHRILDPQGRVIEGEPEMPPLPRRQRIRPGQLIIYDGARDGEPVRVAAFALSLQGTPAELRPFLDEINSLLQRLSHAVEAQSRFVADAAHQLRTPIAGIRAQAEAALASTHPEDARHALKRIAQSALTMGDLAQKLLVLARADAAKNTLQLQRLDALALVRDVARAWAPQAMAQGVEIGFDAPDGDAWVMGDAQLLRELPANLIDNALRYGATRIARLHGATVSLDAADGAAGLRARVAFPPVPTT